MRSEIALTVIVVVSSLNFCKFCFDFGNSPHPHINLLKYPTYRQRYLEHFKSVYACLTNDFTTAKVYMYICYQYT